MLEHAWFPPGQIVSPVAGTAVGAVAGTLVTVLSGSGKLYPWGFPIVGAIVCASGLQQTVAPLASSESVSPAGQL